MHITEIDQIRTAINTLKSDFVTVCLQDQDCFRSERQWETLLSLLPADRGTFIPSQLSSMLDGS